MVQGLGHTGASAQLYSSFPYMSASVLVLVTAYMADRLQLRGPIVLVLLPLSIVGCAYWPHQKSKLSHKRRLIINVSYTDRFQTWSPSSLTPLISVTPACSSLQQVCMRLDHVIYVWSQIMFQVWQKEQLRLHSWSWSVLLFQPHWLGSKSIYVSALGDISWWLHATPWPLPDHQLWRIYSAFCLYTRPGTTLYQGT